MDYSTYLVCVTYYSGTVYQCISNVELRESKQNTLVPSIMISLFMHCGGMKLLRGCVCIQSSFALCTCYPLMQLEQETSSVEGLGVARTINCRCFMCMRIVHTNRNPHTFLSRLRV